MKHAKPAITFLLSSVFVLSLTACGGEKALNSGSSLPVPETSDASSQAVGEQPSSAANSQTPQASPVPSNVPSQLESEPEHKPSRAEVVSCNWLEDGWCSLLITGEGGLSFFSTCEVDETAGALAPGAIIDIYGVEWEAQSYPSGLEGKNITVTVVDPGEDLIGLYRSILNYIYEEGSELNPSDEERLNPDPPFQFGFQLAEVHNLTGQEIGALTHLFCNDHGIARSASGTFSSLAERGYIDPETHRCNHALIFVISDEEISGGSFTFSVRKWKGWQESITRENCTARKTADGWTFDVPPST